VRVGGGAGGDVGGCCVGGGQSLNYIPLGCCLGRETAHLFPMYHSPPPHLELCSILITVADLEVQGPVFGGL